MADMTELQWITLVLNDLGAPVTQNNVNNFSSWIAAENQWPPPRNNPLNNGLGSGGGSGLGSYPDLTTAAQYAAQGLQGGITGAAGIGQALMSDAPFQTFHAATISATWSGDHYAGTEWANASSPTGGGAAGQVANMTTADWAALQAAGQQPGGTAYLTALNAQGTGGTAANANTATSTTIGGTTYGFSGPNAQADASALAQLSANFGAYGFSPTEVQQLTQWSWQELTAGTDPSQVPIDLQNPATGGGAIFAAHFPYFGDVNKSLVAQGEQPLDVATYISNEGLYLQQAAAAGLPQGMVNPQEAATLMKGNVSPSEFGTRLNTALALAYSSTPAQQQAFAQYFGAQYGGVYNQAALEQLNTSGQTPQQLNNAQQTPATGGTAGGPGVQPIGTPALSLGQIAALALDPNIAEPLLAQEVTAAQIGGASVTSGVGALDAATATQLAQAGITLSQATQAFNTQAPYATLEQARPGMGGEAAQGVVTPEQLAQAALTGNTAAQRQQQQAVEVAKAPFEGGGGFVSSAKGAVGAGSASPQGAGNG